MTQLQDQLLEILRGHVSDILSRSILSLSLSWARVDIKQMRPGDDQKLLTELEKGIKLYIRDPSRQRECSQRLGALLNRTGRAARQAAGPSAIVVPINSEADIVTARGCGRDMCREMGFTGAAQIKVATAISELARNIVQYATTGKVTLTRLAGLKKGIEIIAKDHGAGIADIDAVMSDSYRSRTGMGIGLKGTRNLMDDFQLISFPDEGTTVTARKYLG